MCSVQHGKRSGYLFIAGGCMFLLAAFVGKHTTFYSVSAMFLAIGVSYLRKGKGA